MAKATQSAIYTYTLTMNEAEADALNEILFRVGGDPWKSPRKYADSIKTALRRAGATHKNNADVTGNIFFADTEES